MALEFVKPDELAKENEAGIRASVRRRQDWELEIPIKNSRYYLCDQWTQEELDYLRKHNRFPLTINIFAPIVDSFVSLLCGASPKFRSIPLNDESVEEAYLADFVLDYIWHISHGNREMVHWAQDYALSGFGAMMQDWDPNSDRGRGDVVVRYVAWPYVHWDPEACAPGFRDAQWFSIVKTPTVRQVKANWPEHAAMIDRVKKKAFDRMLYGSLENLKSTTNKPNALYDERERARSAKRAWMVNDMTDPSGDMNEDDRRVPVIERYSYEYLEKMSVFDPAVGPEERIVTKEEFAGMVLPDLVRENARVVRVRCVRKVTSLGGWLVLENELRNQSVLPIVPVVKLSAGSALPVAWATRLVDIQDEENKRRLAIIENASNSAVNKLLAPYNMIDKTMYDESKHVSGALIEYTPNFNAPAKDVIIPLVSQQLPNQFYFLEQGAIPMAEYVTGVPAQFLSGQNLPETYKQTLQVESYANKKIRAIDMVEFDAALQTLGQACLEAAQELYTDEKLLSIIDEDNVVYQAQLNTRDVKTGKLMNNLNGKLFSVKLVTGSTMPESRVAKQQMYLELYQLQLIDDIEMLKHVDVMDKQGVIQRKSKLAQAMGVIEQLQEQADQQSGIIQSLQRELVQQQVRLSAKEITGMMQLEQMSAKMRQQLANAMLELQVKSTVKDLQREEEYQKKMSRVRTVNYLDLGRERVRGLVNFARAKTAASNRGEREGE